MKGRSIEHQTDAIDLEQHLSNKLVQVVSPYMEGAVLCIITVQQHYCASL